MARQSIPSLFIQVSPSRIKLLFLTNNDDGGIGEGGGFVFVVSPAPESGDIAAQNDDITAVTVALVPILDQYARPVEDEIALANIDSFFGFLESRNDILFQPRLYFIGRANPQGAGRLIQPGGKLILRVLPQLVECRQKLQEMSA